MRLTIDNLDGLPAVDYSGVLDRSQHGSQPAVVKRVLNAPSTFEATLCLEGSGLKAPVRRGRVVVTADNGTTLFTGYLATNPWPVRGRGERGTGVPAGNCARSAMSGCWTKPPVVWRRVRRLAPREARRWRRCGRARRLEIWRPGQFVTVPVTFGSPVLGAFAPAAARPSARRLARLRPRLTAPTARSTAP